MTDKPKSSQIDRLEQEFSGLFKTDFGKNLLDALKRGDTSRAIDAIDSLNFAVRSGLAGLVKLVEKKGDDAALQRVEEIRESTVAKFRRILPFHRFVWHWLKKIDIGDPGEAHWNAVTWVLEKEGHDPDDKEARLELGRAIADAFQEVRKSAWGDEPPDELPEPDSPDDLAGLILETDTASIVQNSRPGPDVPPEVELTTTADGRQILRQDENLARYLEGLGDEGKRAADNVRGRANERIVQTNLTENRWHYWETWYIEQGLEPPQFPVLKVLGRALWVDVVEPRLAERRERERTLHPALTAAGYDLLNRVYSKRSQTVWDEETRQLQFWSGGNPVHMPGKDPAVLLGNEMLIPDIAVADGTVVEKILRARHKDFTSRVGILALSYYVRTAAKQVAHKALDPRTIRIEGGHEKFAENCGAGTHPERVAQARRVIEAHAMLWPFGQQWEPLIMRHYTSPTKGRPAILDIVVGPLLCPYDLFNQLGENARAGRELFPMIDMKLVPTKIKGVAPRATAAVMRLAWESVAVMRGQSMDLKKKGGARFDLDAMAEKAELPSLALPKVVDRFTRDGNDCPAVWKRVGKDRFALGDAHKDSWEFMLTAGRRALGYRKKARRSIAKRDR